MSWKVQPVISAFTCCGSITQIHCELHSASVQLQTQGVGWLLRCGGHQQPEGSLGHEAEGHVLGLGVHRPGQHHFQIHAAVVAHCGGLLQIPRRGERDGGWWAPEGVTQLIKNTKWPFADCNLGSLPKHPRCCLNVILDCSFHQPQQMAEKAWSMQKGAGEAVATIKFSKGFIPLIVQYKRDFHISS